MYVNLEEHKNLSLEEIREEIKSLTIGRHFYNKMPNMVSAIKKQTQCLDKIYPNVEMNTRIDFIRKGFSTIEDLLCPVCDNGHLSISAKKLFNTACCRKCIDVMNRKKISDAHQSRSEEEIRVSNEKRKSTCNAVYETDNVAKLPEIQKKWKETNKALYGTPYPSQLESVKRKFEETCLKNLGVRNPMQCKDVLQKTKQTLRKTHNVENVSQIPEVKEKKRETLLKNHMVENPMYSEELKKKALENSKSSLMETHGVSNPILVVGALEKREKTYYKNWNASHPQKTEEMKEQNRKRAYDRLDNVQKLAHDILRNKEELENLYKEKGALYIAEEYKIAYQTVYKFLGIHDIELEGFTKISKGEQELFDYIKNELGFSDAMQSRRKLMGDRKEIDIFIPSMGIGIEFNGVYYHSSKILEDDYHYNKWYAAKSVGINLIQIFEDEWSFKKNIVKKKLKNILKVDNSSKVYARNTICVTLTNADSFDFLENNHIQGHVNGSIVIGLNHGGNIVGVMVFKRNGTDGGVELTRYATSVSVVGGFSKLLNFFIKNYGKEFKNIVSFADKRWSSGNLYLKTGFDHVYDTAPSYTYVVGNMRKHKSGFRKERLSKILKNYDPTLTERTNTFMNKIYRIYDCGLMKFVLDLSKYEKETEQNA